MSVRVPDGSVEPLLELTDPQKGYLSKGQRSSQDEIVENSEGADAQRRPERV